MAGYGNSRSGISSWSEITRFNPRTKKMELVGISVTFKNGRNYVYSIDVYGEKNIEAMIEYGKRGRGLNTYINRFIKRR